MFRKFHVQAVFDEIPITLSGQRSIYTILSVIIRFLIKWPTDLVYFLIRMKGQNITRIFNWYFHSFPSTWYGIWSPLFRNQVLLLEGDGWNNTPVDSICQNRNMHVQAVVWTELLFRGHNQPHLRNNQLQLAPVTF